MSNNICSPKLFNSFDDGNHLHGELDDREELVHRGDPARGPAADELRALAAEVIAELLFIAPHIQEGTVMTMGPAPYRRLDCDRRALAYVRARPRKGMVRIDVSGLWLLPRTSPLFTQSSGASATLVLRSAEDKNEAIAFLLAVVEATRAQHAKLRVRDEQRRQRKHELRTLFRRDRGRNGRGGPASAAPIAEAG